MVYIMDTNEEERVKLRIGFLIKIKWVKQLKLEEHILRLRQQGSQFWMHLVTKSYVPNMISGASQADIGVLGEFETGYERGGQTHEHGQLAKTRGVARLLLVVNKMDDPAVHWSKERYDEIESKMMPFLKQSGYIVKKVFYQNMNMMGALDWYSSHFKSFWYLLGVVKA